MFGDLEKNNKNWDVDFLENVTADIVDCPHSTPIHCDKKTEYACVRTSELVDGYIFWDSMKYVNEKEYNNRIKRIVPQEEDIVYGREGSFGEAIRIPKNPYFCLGQRTMLLRPDNRKCNSIFLWAMIRSEFVYRQAFRKNSGSTVGHVNVKDIKKFKILVPPISLQNKFSLIVNHLEEMTEKQKKSQQEINNLINTLIQKAFTGELVV